MSRFPSNPVAFGSLLVIVCGWLPALAVASLNFEELVAARSVIEKVYHGHRINTKEPFEQAVPVSLVESKVRRILRKEAILQSLYRVRITEEMVEAEIDRIEANTRAPGRLQEIKSALGNDPRRYAEAYVKPLVVDRRLRALYQADERIHRDQRQGIDALREQLLAATDRQLRAELLRRKGSLLGQVREWSWNLQSGAGSESSSAAAPISPDGDRPGAAFEDLPDGLKRILAAQLKRPGDVSAVIEAPRGYLLYLASEATDEILAVLALSSPKPDYETWCDRVPIPSGDRSIGTKGDQKP